jgi:hypothetical protein
VVAVHVNPQTEVTSVTDDANDVGGGASGGLSNADGASLLTGLRRSTESGAPVIAGARSHSRSEPCRPNICRARSGVAPQPHVGPRVHDAIERQAGCLAQAGGTDRARMRPKVFEDDVASKHHASTCPNVSRRGNTHNPSNELHLL